jgi:hypothetical protein
MTTMHQLYQRHGTALDCACLARELSTPTHGVSEFEAFCRVWPKVCVLLDMRAVLECYDARTGRWWVPTWNWYTPKTVAEGIEKAMSCEIISLNRRRIVLLDGTVIREWGAQ